MIHWTTRRRTPHPGRKLAAFTAPAAALLLLALAAAPALAGVVGQNGEIHACYLVKGKPKGAVRLVGAKKHCKRGERKVAWSIVGSPGQAGAGGQSGTGGQQGSAGTSGSSAGNQAALETKVASLTLRVEELEGTLHGLTNKGLSEAVAAVPAVEALCEQAPELTEQINLVSEVVEGIGLNGVLTGLGGVLNIPSLPEELEPFSC